MAKSKKKSAGVQAREQARAAARAEAERLKAAQAAKDRRTRLMTLAGLAAVLLVVVIIVVVVSVGRGGGGKSGFDSIEVKPTGATESGGIRLGQDLVPGGAAPTGGDVVTVAIYSDFMCPYCGVLELNHSEVLANLVRNGDIQLELHTLAILDDVENAEQYSTRTAIAATAVAKNDPDNYWAFVHALFTDQPQEGQETRTDEQIAATARSVGVNEAAMIYIADQTLAEWVDFATAQAFMDGVRGTPAIKMSIGGGEPHLLTYNDITSIGFDKAVANLRDGLSPMGE
ncbi:MAG: DsbA family protein [Micrococcales bacterium]|nr:DsbA family protein [Micrococcales bacterium]